MLVEGPSADSELVWQARLVDAGAGYRRRLLHFRSRRAAARSRAKSARMRITEAHDYDLTGELMDATPQLLHPACVQIGVQARFRDSMTVSDLPKGSQTRRSLHAVLQRPLPHHRSGQLGFGEIRDLRRRSDPADDSDAKMKTTIERAGPPDRHWFYCGYAPKAPGTAGSLAALAIAWLLHAVRGRADRSGFALLARGADRSRDLGRRT